MNLQRRAVYAEYIASALRFAELETKLKWPEETCIVTTSYGELASLDEILGWPILVMDMPSSYEFFVAFPPMCSKVAGLQKAFLEYLDLYNIDE
jgi:hypothetical protein